MLAGVRTMTVKVGAETKRVSGIYFAQKERSKPRQQLTSTGHCNTKETQTHNGTQVTTGEMLQGTI